MKGVFDLFKPYHYGRYRDNDRRIEYGYKPLKKDHKKGDYIYGYIDQKTNPGSVVRLNKRSDALRWHQRKNRRHRLGDHLTKVYGRVVYEPSEKNGSYSIKTAHSHPVYLDQKSSGSLVCRSDEKGSSRMGFRRWFYGHRDRDVQSELGYENIQNASPGKSVFGYVYGSANPGEEVQLLSRSEALDLYEQECRLEKRSYRLGDHLTKVYGRLNEQGELVKVAATNPVYLDLRKSGYDFRTKALKEIPVVEQEIETEVGAEQIEAGDIPKESIGIENDTNLNPSIDPEINELQEEGKGEDLSTETSTIEKPLEIETLDIEAELNDYSFDQSAGVEEEIELEGP